MMRSKAPLAAVALTVMMAIPGPAMSQECSYDAGIHVDVEIAFAEPFYQQDWVYHNLQPNILIDGLDEPSVRYVRVKHSVSDGRLVSSFDLLVRSETIVSAKTLTLAVTYGLREIPLLPRPVRWSPNTAAPTDPCAKALTRLSPISLDDQPTPDWVILRGAKVQHSIDGDLFIDVELMNPTGLVHPSMDVVLNIEVGDECLPWDIACLLMRPVGTIPGTAIVPVVIRLLSCGASTDFATASSDLQLPACDPETAFAAFSGDGQDPTLIEREINYELRGNIGFIDIALGGTGPVHLRSSYRLRYIIEVENIDLLRYRFRQSNNRISIFGGRVWPESVLVEGR